MGCKGCGCGFLTRFLSKFPLFWKIIFLALIFLLLCILCSALMAMISSTNRTIKNQNAAGEIKQMFDFIGFEVASNEHEGGGVQEGIIPDVIGETASVEKINIQAGFQLKDKAAYNKDFLKGDYGMEVTDMELCITLGLPDDVKIDDINSKLIAGNVALGGVS